MPRQIIRNRVFGQMIEQHVGGEETDEFRVLGDDRATPLISFSTMAAAQNAGKVVSGLKLLGETLDDAEKLREFEHVMRKLLVQVWAKMQEPQEKTQQEETDGGADLGRLLTGDETQPAESASTPASAGADGAQPATAAQAGTDVPAVDQVAAGAGSPPAAAQGNPGEASGA